MASLAQPAVAATHTPWQWFRSFLAQEFAPYPGRAWTVARMTIAATIVMLWIMVFRIPNAALGAYYTLLFSRESPQATIRSALTVLPAVGASLVFILAGVITLTGDPLLHFMWVAGTLFVTFFLIDSLTIYRAGTAFGFLAVNSITGWDFPANTEMRLEGTLWTALAVATAALVTVVVELVFQRVHPLDQFHESLDDRIRNVENLLRCFAQNREPDEATRQKLAQYAMLGTALLRRLLLRSNRNPQDMAEMSTVVALVGRLVDLSANVANLNLDIREENRPYYQRTADTLARLRSALKTENMRDLAQIELPAPSAAPPGSFLAGIERTMSRLHQAFAGMQPLAEFLPSSVDFAKPSPLFKEDAFTNPAHLRFALRGTLAALSCYIIYNAIDWRGLSTAVATCMITALSNVGSSRQKQLLRVSGALLGGVGFAIGSEIFLTPRMDGITEFTLLFVVVTAISSWIATSSPRISYAGAQTAFAFYVTHLRGFGPQISISVARDDVMGIMFGLLAMWLSFDRIWAKAAATEMMDSFVANIRRIARFDKQIAGEDMRGAIDRSRAQRAAISTAFDQIRNESDAVLFEWGAGWRSKIELRDRVRAWQPQLRTYFLLQIAVAQYRLQTPTLQLEADIERNVQSSEELLTLLADLEDSQKRDQVKITKQQILARLPAEGEKLKPDGENAQTSRTTPLALSRSMLEVAVSLGRQMTSV